MRYSLAWGMGQTGHGAWDCPVYLINLQSAVSYTNRFVVKTSVLNSDLISIKVLTKKLNYFL